MRLLRTQRRDEGRVADDMAGAHPGDRPRLRQRSHDEHPGHVATDEALALTGHEIHERLVDDEHASGTAQLLELRARVEHARRVRRVAEDDEIGAVERRDVSVPEVRTGADVEHVRPGRAPGAA